MQLLAIILAMPIQVVMASHLYDMQPFKKAVDGCVDPILSALNSEIARIANCNVVRSVLNGYDSTNTRNVELYCMETKNGPLEPASRINLPACARRKYVQMKLWDIFRDGRRGFLDLSASKVVGSVGDSLKAIIPGITAVDLNTVVKFIGDEFKGMRKGSDCSKRFSFGSQFGRMRFLADRIDCGELSHGCGGCLDFSVTEDTQYSFDIAKRFSAAQNKAGGAFNTLVLEVWQELHAVYGNGGFKSVDAAKKALRESADEIQSKVEAMAARDVAKSQ